MTVVQVPVSPPRRYVGLSGDTKPTAGIPTGTVFYETDTDAIYTFVGGAWVAETIYSSGGGGGGGGGGPATIADGADVTLGAKADAKSTATDTTAITAMSVWKQISASIQAVAAAVADAWDDASNAIRVDPGTLPLAAASDAIACDTFRNAAVSNTAVAVKASPGTLYGYVLHNPSVDTVFVQLYDVAAASVTVGTTTPKLTIPIQSGASEPFFSDVGVSFGTAIAVAVTTTATGGTAPAAAALVGLLYK